MAQQTAGAGNSGDRVSLAGEAIPMKKTGVTTYAAIGVGVLAIVGIVAVSAGGKDKDAEKKAAEIKAKASQQDKPQLTAKERQEHMKMTALAFEKAEEDAKAKKAEEARKKAQADAAKQASMAQAPAPAAAPAPKKKGVSQKAAKKQMDSLDSMGSDIASALK